MPDGTTQLPEFTRWINPVLHALSELGGSARPQEVVERVAKNEGVGDELMDQLNPAGGQRFGNQVHWARFYLADAGLIDRTKRGVWKLTEAGSLAAPLSLVQLTALYDEVQTRHRKQKPGNSSLGQDVSPGNQSGTPTHSVDEGESAEFPPPDVGDLDHRARLIDILRALSPAGFERLCQRMLREAGFEQVVVTGKSGDGGIDGHGILSLNPFVSFRVLFQCKRYAGSVTPAQVRDFRGAMQGRADKGLILTTGSFTTEARREAGRDGAPPIELVDGEKLVDLFESLELGLRRVAAYDIDDGFFDEYR